MDGFQRRTTIGKKSDQLKGNLRLRVSSSEGCGWPAGLLNWARRVVAAARAFTCQLGEPGPIPGEIAPGFSHAGIAPVDAADRRVLSGVSRFPRSQIQALLHTHLTSPSSVLKIPIGSYGSEDLAFKSLPNFQISSLTHSLTHSLEWLTLDDRRKLRFPRDHRAEDHRYVVLVYSAATRCRPRRSDFVQFKRKPGFSFVSFARGGLRMGRVRSEGRWGMIPFREASTRIKSSIAPKCKTLNWRAVFSSCCVYLWDFQRRPCYFTGGNGYAWWEGLRKCSRYREQPVPRSATRSTAYVRQAGFLLAPSALPRIFNNRCFTAPRISTRCPEADLRHYLPDVWGGPALGKHPLPHRLESNHRGILLARWQPSPPKTCAAGGLVVRLRSYHQGELDSIAGEDIRTWETRQTLPLARGFSQAYPVPLLQPLHSIALASPHFTLILPALEDFVRIPLCPNSSYSAQLHDQVNQSKDEYESPFFPSPTKPGQHLHPLHNYIELSLVHMYTDHAEQTERKLRTANQKPSSVSAPTELLNVVSSVLIYENNTLFRPDDHRDFRNSRYYLRTD
ncbi:hypothetical protein PR048_026231 [Dryococelus australis]|uniref:Uncharacterized protein n=1 Tax=Dryococelus australis TaxID=614101 RepID=A0ABQ9GKS4_9NEOP|nr:hypothetical protein PR048_026231 [Dryococelus australis]